VRQAQQFTWRATSHQITQAYRHLIIAH
jgi:hypothetical protein